MVTALHVARTSVATSKVDLLSGEVQGWSDALGGHDRGSRSTQIQLLNTCEWGRKRMGGVTGAVHVIPPWCLFLLVIPDTPDLARSQKQSSLDR